ncbi:MAG: DMT family transporter [Acidobacteria bacterium]|nr:DMT family transporter [Acidobacteriota bacterium]
MARSYPVVLLAFAALWGANFALIKLAVDEVEPTTMGTARLLLAALALLPFVVLRFGVRTMVAQLRRIGWRIFVVAFFNHALAFVLIAWGEKHIDSSVAAIANATMPLFVALIAIKVRESERATGLRMLGIIVGLGGVAVLAGFDLAVSMMAILGTLAVVVAALSTRSACSTRKSATTTRPR